MPNDKIDWTGPFWMAVAAVLIIIIAMNDPWPKCNANSPPAFGIGNAWVQEGCVRHAGVGKSVSAARQRE